MVLCDSPVRRLILRIDSFSRKDMRLMIFKNPMWRTALGKGHMAQFSVEIIP
jgi:hypothetical protein